MVAEEQKKLPNKMNVFLGGCLLSSALGGERQSTKYQRCRYAETYVTLTKSGGLILIHIRFFRLQQLGGSKRIGIEAS